MHCRLTSSLSGAARRLNEQPLLLLAERLVASFSGSLRIIIRIITRITRIMRIMRVIGTMSAHQSAQSGNEHRKSILRNHWALTIGSYLP